jgi:hypothetical protein
VSSGKSGDALSAERTPPSLAADGIGNAIEMSGLEDPRNAAASLDNGREICAPDTVPFAQWAASKHLDDLEAGLWATAAVGGDIDTNCAIVGGIIAARTGQTRSPRRAWPAARSCLDWAGTGVTRTGG